MRRRSSWLELAISILIMVLVLYFLLEYANRTDDGVSESFEATVEDVNGGLRERYKADTGMDLFNEYEEDNRRFIPTEELIEQGKNEPSFVPTYPDH